MEMLNNSDRKQLIANWHSQGYHSQGDADDRLEGERPLVKMRRKAEPKVFSERQCISSWQWAAEAGGETGVEDCSRVSESVAFPGTKL